MGGLSLDQTGLLFALEIRPTSLLSLLHIAVPLQLSPENYCSCCRNCASSAMRSMEGRAVSQRAGHRFKKIRDFFRDVHAAHLHRTCGAVLCLCCKACCGRAVQHCEQRCLGQLQSDVDGKELARSDGQSEFRKNRSSTFCRKTEVHFFLEKLDSIFFEIRLRHLSRKGGDIPCDPCGRCTCQRENGCH